LQFAELLPPHLYGSVNFGDNIQDEWFIVSLLFKLSREIPGLVVRTVDADGEFMLIEAAENLPSWANPNTCKQRVIFSKFLKNLDFIEYFEKYFKILFFDKKKQNRYGLNFWDSNLTLFILDM
jgi:hypothetical protein